MTWLYAHRWSIATMLVIGAMVAPVAFDRDSFPLSTYPMYAAARPDEVSFPTAVAEDSSGGTHRLTLALVGASDDPLIVAGELRQAIARGDAARRCAEIARRVRSAGAAEDSGERLVAVEVVVERHHVIAHVSGEESLLDRSVHARCPVPDGP